MAMVICYVRQERNARIFRLTLNSEVGVLSSVQRYIVGRTWY